MQNIVNQNSGKDFPYAIRKLKGVLHNNTVKAIPAQPDGFVQIGREKWLMPTSYADYAETIYNFEARADDVFICTYPRSGTTWTQEMIWLICNDLDYETAMNINQKVRFPYLEMHLMMNETNLSNIPQPSKLHDMAKKMMSPMYEKLEAQTTRRFIKTHLPIQLMPRNALEVGAKIVYVARNPKDVAVSYYHFHKSVPTFGFTGGFDSFVPYFMDDLLIYGPYWKHILDGYKYRNHKNVHFMFYEDAKMDMASSLKKLAEFLEKPLSDDDLPKLIEHLKFENVSKNPSINLETDPSNPASKMLIRRGKVGGNPEMTKEMTKKIDEWTKISLKDSDLKFPC